MARTGIVTRPRTSKNQDLNETIRKKAYELYQKRGCTQGDPMQDWLEAEKMVKQKVA